MPTPATQEAHLHNGFWALARWIFRFKIEFGDSHYAITFCCLWEILAAVSDAKMVLVEISKKRQSL